RDDKVVLRIAEDGKAPTEILADRVIAGTGYEFELGRMTFLNPSLRTSIRRWNRSPRLSRNFESSVRGLYFVGPIAAESFGPLVRFVAGSYFMVRTVSGHLTRRPNPLAAMFGRPGAASARRSKSLAEV